MLGESILRNLYIDLDEEQYQPNSIDLKLDKILTLSEQRFYPIGLYDGKKKLPEYNELEVWAKGQNNEPLYKLEPKTSYIVVIDGKIEIPENVAQFYLPRSSLLRCGLSLHTALGDSGFKGHLQFLITNENNFPVLLGKGERIATAVFFTVQGATKYDGDYQEE